LLNFTFTHSLISFLKILNFQEKYPGEFLLSGPQRALISTISTGQRSISETESLLLEKIRLPVLGNDPASMRWRESQKNTNKQSVHSLVSALNAATAQMVKCIYFSYQGRTIISKLELIF